MIQTAKSRQSQHLEVQSQVSLCAWWTQPLVHKTWILMVCLSDCKMHDSSLGLRWTQQKASACQGLTCIVGCRAPCPLFSVSNSTAAAETLGHSSLGSKWIPETYTPDRTRVIKQRRSQSAFKESETNKNNLRWLQTPLFLGQLCFYFISAMSH